MRLTIQSNINNVLILTGPGGSGKSTIAGLLASKYCYSLVNGDELDTEYFPNGGQRMPENINQLRLAHKKILARTKVEFENGRDVVVDYIIFGDYENFFKIFKDEFGDNLGIKVLLPSKEENIRRDAGRESWTTGIKNICEVRQKLVSLKNNIGTGNYIDSSNLTPEETVELLF